MVWSAVGSAGATPLWLNMGTPESISSHLPIPEDCHHLGDSDTVVTANGRSTSPGEAKAVSPFVPHSATALHALAA